MKRDLLWEGEEEEEEEEKYQACTRSSIFIFHRTPRYLALTGGSVRRVPEDSAINSADRLHVVNGEVCWYPFDAGRKLLYPGGGADLALDLSIWRQDHL